MAIQRWRPSGEFREMERLMDDMFRHPSVPWRGPLTWWRTPVEEIGWLPPMEMYEKGDNFVVKMELPGMKEDEIDIHVVGNTLTVSGERKSESEVKEKDYYSCELNYGSFSRSVSLPSAVDATKIEASLEKGILEITIPKAEIAKPKKVGIKAKGAKPKETKASEPKNPKK